MIPALVFSIILHFSQAGPIYDTPQNLLVAYYGDLGLSNTSAYVLKMVKAEGAELIVHAGDLDYSDNATAFDAFLNQHLGEDFPYLAAAGNHDITEWGEYKAMLLNRYHKIFDKKLMKCGGNVPDTYWCIYRGVFFGLSSIGVLSDDYLQASLQLEQHLSEAQQLLRTEGGNSTWKVCAWHKNQHLTQIGSKEDDASWNPFETCRRHGAMISNGHEHSYSRSHLIKKFEDPIQVSGTTSPYLLKNGQTMFFTNGLGGKGVRTALPELKVLPWWAKTQAIEDGVTGVAVFCKYNVDGKLDQAYCYAKDVNKGIIDSWNLTSRDEGLIEPYVFQQPPLSRRMLTKLAAGLTASVVFYGAIVIFLYFKCEKKTTSEL